MFVACLGNSCTSIQFMGICVCGSVTCKQHAQQKETKICGTLPKTTIAPENRSGPKRKGSSSSHPFSGVNSLAVSGRVSQILQPLKTCETMTPCWNFSGLAHIEEMAQHPECLRCGVEPILAEEGPSCSYQESESIG